MKIKEIFETTAGSVAAVPMGIGTMMTRQPKNADGTVKNALDMVSKKKKPKYETTIYHSLINKKYKHGDYAKSTGKIPPAKPGRTAHPLHGKLVG